MGFFQNALDFINGWVFPATTPASTYYHDSVQPALIEGQEYIQTAVLPAMESALSKAGDYVQTAALPAASYVKANLEPVVEHAKELSLQVWEGEVAGGGKSLKEIVTPALNLISPALDFVVKNPWILLPILVPALQVWLGIIGFTVEGVKAGSIAAAIHSSIGNAKKGSVFAFLQSYGARGFASNAVRLAGMWLVIAVVLAAVGKVLIEKGVLEEDVCKCLQPAWEAARKDLVAVTATAT